MIAQAQMDVVHPWVTLILQGGAFALVVYIVVIAYPRSTKEAREEREQRDARFVQVIDTMQDKFEQRSNQIVTATKEQTASLSKTFTDSALRIEMAVAHACKANERTNHSGPR